MRHSRRRTPPRYIRDYDVRKDRQMRQSGKENAIGCLQIFIGFIVFATIITQCVG